MVVESNKPMIDIIIPVYNEGENIIRVLQAFRLEIKTPVRILICYDDEKDTTLTAINASGFDKQVVLVKNRFRPKGAHGAVHSGMLESTADAIITFMADDDYNVSLIDNMISCYQEGNEIVAPSRFIPGGVFEGCRWPKNFLVRATSRSLYTIAQLPVHDATNGFRLFSRRLLDVIQLESTEGFTYSIELLVKCHRLGWKMIEIPAKWYERTHGQSRFKVFQWARAYLHWYWYAFKTTYLRMKSL